MREKKWMETTSARDADAILVIARSVCHCLFLGLTSITENGSGLHTRAYVNLSGFNGSWSDNAGNSNQSLVFNPGTTCPRGPRTGPTVPVTSDAQGSMQAEPKKN